VKQPEHPVLPAACLAANAAHSALELWENTWRDTMQQVAIMADCLQVQALH
jgi:hypothetical protein